jgi:hypothetical protein
MTEPCVIRHAQAAVQLAPGFHATTEASAVVMCRLPTMRDLVMRIGAGLGWSAEPSSGDLITWAWSHDRFIPDWYGWLSGVNHGNINTTDPEVFEP